MRALCGQRWIDGLLDYHQIAGTIAIRPTLWIPLFALDDCYFIRKLDWRLLWNYQNEIGVINTMRKALSRLNEKNRNDKWLGVGLGVAEGSPEGLSAFIATWHPRAVDRIVLPPNFCCRWGHPLPPALNLNRLKVSRPVNGELADNLLQEVAGWSQHSGTVSPDASMKMLFDRLPTLIERAEWLHDIDNPPRTAICESRVIAATGSTRPTGVLYGLGQYAKTCLLPNLDRYVNIIRCHEIDPLQIGPPARQSRSYSTADGIDRAIDANAYFFAGYHHTHAPLASEVLRHGRIAVIEKPISTTRAQQAELISALGTGGKLFAGFHKRYAAFNEFLRHDLGVQAWQKGPIDCHCIVYEVPLPQRHWYRWPNSRSRVLSNGCHWLDHFLFVNGFSRPVRKGVRLMARGIINIEVELENTAVLTLCLTDTGSDRVGIRELVEYRHRRRTARITDGSTYVAENERRILRRAAFNKMSSYARMYKEIGRQILTDAAGDPLESIVVSGGLAIDLDEIVERLECA